MTRFVKLHLAVLFFAVGAGIAGLCAAHAEKPQTQNPVLAKVIARCARCHSYEPGKHKRTGPTLYNVIGRKVGLAEGFRFSKSYVQIGRKDVQWTSTNLQTYLENNRDFLKNQTGNARARGRMNYNLKDANQRKLIANYLATLGAAPDVAEPPPATENPEVLPEP